MEYKLFRFEKTLYQGNLHHDVFRYCVKKHHDLCKYIFPMIFNAILYFFHIRKHQAYVLQRWQFYYELANSEALMNEFVNTNKKKMRAWMFSDLSQRSIVIDAVPEFIMQAYLPGYNVRGIRYDGKQYVYHEFMSQKEDEVLHINSVYDDHISKFLRFGKNKYIVSNNTIQLVDRTFLIQYVVKYIITICTLALLSGLIMLTTFINATAILNTAIFGSYFLSSKLLFYNFMPIFMVMLFFYFLTDRPWLSFAVTGYFFYILSLVNKLKLRFRDDPFVWSDIKLAGEAGDMAGKYDISLGLTQIAFLILFAIGTYAVFLYFKRSRFPSQLRYGMAVMILLFTGYFIQHNIFDADTYKSLGDESVINKWSQSQQFQSRGFVYPFLYSYTYASEQEPENYDPDLAKETLAQEAYSDIPEGQKVNIISIMLESYNDLSKFEGVEFETDVYDKLHEIQDEAISGDLIVNIFAGGTVATERSFLNGYFNHPDYGYSTNSFVRYFNEQGYYTEALHPSYGWFYNRRNVNEYLGFQNFLYTENYYGTIAYDDIFFPDIIKQYENSKTTGKPYFNYSLNYQGHGPYATTDIYGIKYLKWQDGYNESDYNNINNYLYLIANTTNHLYDLIQYFKKEDEPTIVVFFGDHNPLLNDNSSGFDMLGVNLSLDTQEGFENYFEVPYVIWANDSAKTVFQKDFVGEGEKISPNYLMTYLFEYLGWEGNEYMHYLSKMKDVINIMNSTMKKVNGEWMREESNDIQTLYENYRNVEYYYSHNLLKHDE